MRVRSWAGLLAATLLLFLTSGPSSFAENEDALRFGNHRFPFRQPDAPRARVRSREPAPGYYAAPTQYYYPGRPGSAGPVEQRYQRRYYYDDPREVRRTEPLYEAARPRKVRRAPPVAAPSVARAKPEEKQEEAEVEPSTTIVVFGDSLAEMVGQGLDEAYEEALDVEVVRKVRGDSGLVRQDHHDWPRTVQEVVNGAQKITFAVLMLGSNDRQSIREGEASHDPLSDRWRQIYRERVDATLKPLVDKKIPFVWVGAPPVKNERLSADLIALNEIYRDRVRQAGGIYVDVWPGFVDDENRYAVSGPDLDGQVTRLRTADGVHFTRAGARKAAHFAEAELKRLIEQRNASGGVGIATVPAVPAPGLPASGGAARNVDEIIAASLPALPEPPGLPSLAVKPVAGPVLPLTRPETSPGGALTTSRPKLDEDAAYLVERALRQGVAPAPRPGRADDFRWPRS